MIPVDQIDYAIVRFRYREITDASAQEKSPALWPDLSLGSIELQRDEAG